MTREYAAETGAPQMPVQQLPKGVEADTIRRMFDESRASYDALEAAWEGLLAEHEGEWVAGYRGDFVFAKTVEKVIDSARDKGWPIGVMAIQQLRRERAAVLL